MTDLRIVLLGKSGVGKSSLCNTILEEEDVFTLGHTANSETAKCERETRRVKGRIITLIDTPGFFGTNKSEENLSPDLAECITECAPGVHAFLIVLKVERFTEQENQVIDRINKCLSEEAFKHAVVVFTHGDQLKKKMRIDGFVQQNEGLKELLNKCDNRYQVTDNKCWRNKWWRKYRDNKVQVEQLLSTIQKLTSTKGLYTNEMLKAVESKIQQGEERVTSQHLSKEEVKRNISDLFKAISGVTTGEMLGALLGAPGMVGSVVKAIAEAAIDLKIVLLGKTEFGKSSLCNTMFKEENVFNKGNTAISETAKCQKETRCVDGRIITLIDTPGFFGTNKSERNLSPDLAECITECAPGVHAFLIVLKVERFTEQENQVIDRINERLSEEAFKHAVVVFTHGDQLKEKMGIDGFVQQNEGLKKLLNKCDNRYQVTDNKCWGNKWSRKYMDNKVQVEQLLSTIQKLTSTKGLYTNEMLKAVESKIQQGEERLRKTSPHLSKEEIREKMKRNISDLLKAISGVTTGEMLGALLGAPGMVASVAKAIAEAAIDLKIVLLGKTGAGKSSLCNTMFEEEDVFTVGYSAISETAFGQKETRCVDGRIITLIDTPGFFDTKKSDEGLKPEIMKCITECAPGVHAFLIVLRVERFTEQENQVIDRIQSYFGEEAFKRAVVVFTHGDQLNEGMKIEEFVSPNEKLSDLLKKCRNRCRVTDNQNWRNNQDEYRNNEVQVKELLNTIQQLADEEGLYTNEMLQAVEGKIKQEEERLRQISPDRSAAEIREEAKRNVANHLKKISGVTTGVLLGALLGVPVMVASVVVALAGAGAVEETIARAAAAAAEVRLGIAAGVAAADSVRGAVVNAAKAVIDMAKDLAPKKRQSEDKMPLVERFS